MTKLKNTQNLCILPIAMQEEKYKSPIGHTEEENNPMKIQNCVLERRKQRFR